MFQVYGGPHFPGWGYCNPAEQDQASMATFVHQAIVRRDVVVELILDMKQRGHHFPEGLPPPRPPALFLEAPLPHTSPLFGWGHECHQTL